MGLGSKLILSYCCTGHNYNEFGVHPKEKINKKSILLFNSVYVQCRASDLNVPELRALSSFCAVVKLHHRRAAGVVLLNYFTGEQLVMCCSAARR